MFSVVDIDEKLFSAAYPLVRTAMPDVTEQQWSDYARKARMRGGMLGLFGAEGTLFGLLTYRNEESLRHGLTFHIDQFITFELSRSGPGRRALCEAAERLARAQGCAAIELRMPDRGDVERNLAKAQAWLNLGHRVEAVMFTKSLDQAGCDPGRDCAQPHGRPSGLAPASFGP